MSKKKKEEEQLLLLNGEPLKTLSGEDFCLLTQGGDAIATETGDAINTSLPEPEIKNPTFRVPYEAMKMKTTYKDNALDILSEETKGLVLEAQAAGDFIHSIGIDLTPAEDRALMTICKLLKDKSEHKDEKSELFYQGNVAPDQNALVSHNYNGTAIQLKTAQYSISTQEYYRAYLGGKKPSGKNIKDINETLDSLANKNVALRFQVPIGKNVKTGEPLYDYYEGVDRLFSVVKVTKGVTQTEIDQLDKGNYKIRKEKGELVIRLHPLFTLGIANKYVNLPYDIYERTLDAAGHPRNVTQATNILRDYLFTRLRDMKLSKNGYTFEINTNNLYQLLKLGKYLKRREEKEAKKAANNAIAPFVKMGLIKSVKEVAGAEGQDKHIFTLNENFE